MLQQGSTGNTCARACLRTTVPEIILLVVHHPQHVCVCDLPVRVSSCPPGPLHLPTWQRWTQRHPSFSHHDTAGIYLHSSFNYSAAEQLWPGIRAVDSEHNAWQLGWKWRNWHCDTSNYHLALCDYRHCAMNRYFCESHVEGKREKTKNSVKLVGACQHGDGWEVYCSTCKA